MTDSLKIVYILDDRYWYPVTVSAKSALFCFKHQEAKLIEFIFLVDGVTLEHQRLMEGELTTANSIVRFVAMDVSYFKEFPSYHGTKIIWMRCKLNSLLPDINGWVCICDGDTIWLKSPMKVFDLTCQLDEGTVVCGSYNNGAEGNVVAHLMRRGIRVPESTYFCVGFVMLHLGRMKAMEGERKAEEFMMKYGPTEFPEQDIFNVIFLDNKKILPMGWGVAPKYLSNVSIDEVGLIHYYGSLPWPSSYRARMSDAEALWWRFAIKNVNVCPGDVQFKMNFVLYLCMRFWNLLIRVFPSGTFSGRCKDVRLPLRRLLASLNSWGYGQVVKKRKKK